MIPSFADFKVEKLMTEDVLTLTIDDVLRVWDESTNWRKFRHLPVVDSKGKLIGMVSHRDLMNRVASAVLNPEKRETIEKYQAIPLKEVMRREILTVPPDESLQDAAKKMFESQVGALPVVDQEGTLLGILSEADFVELVHFGEEVFKNP